MAGLPTVSRLDRLLVLGGALWASAALHGAVAIVGGVLDAPEELRIEVSLYEPESVEQERAASAPPEPQAVSEKGASEDAPEPVGEQAQPNAADEQAPPERKHWRARLRDDQRRYDEEMRDRDARMAKVRDWDARRKPAESDEAIHRCGAGGRGPQSAAKVRRTLARLGPVLPSGVLPEAYLEQIGELGWSRNNGRVTFDLALPAALLPIRLEEPDVLVAVGREDARCRVGISVGPDLFPIQLLGLPVRIVDERGRVEAAVVDVSMNVDATVRVTAIHEGRAGVRKGRLFDAKNLSRRMRDHQAIFLALKALRPD